MNPNSLPTSAPDAAASDGRPDDDQLDYHWGLAAGDHRAYARAVLRLAEIGSVRTAVNYRNGNTALIEALMQLIGAGTAPPVEAMQAAQKVLADAGMLNGADGSLNWAALAARKAAAAPQQMTWAEAVALCVPDAAERARLLALDDESDDGVLEGTNRTTSGAIGQP